MEGNKGIVLVMLFFMVIFSVASDIIDQSPIGVEMWFDKIYLKEQKITKLSFYLHDTRGGTNPTAINVAQANMTATSPTLFGLTLLIDDPMRVGPEPNSIELGRAQGIFASTDMNEYGLFVNFNLIFTSGKYNGSTLSVLGKISISHKYREMPIVGGTGIFRLARGIVTAQTYMLNFTSFDAIVKFNVIVIHY